MATLDYSSLYTSKYFWCHDTTYKKDILNRKAEFDME